MTLIFAGVGYLQWRFMPLKVGRTNRKHIANILNSTFTNHEELDINPGVLIAIPKPGKPKGPPNNLRAITLLNTLRKVISLITLDRIRPSIEKYLSHSQSGFRPERSTSDVVWTHRWLAAKTVTENINIKITGVDMSAAFDTIDRDILLQILKNIFEEDELRLIQFLLSNTHINTRINNADINAPFTSKATDLAPCSLPYISNML